MPETEDAPAKLNLYLRVLGRRPDGYHDIDSVTLRVSLHDRVTVTPTDADPAIRVAVAGPGAAGVPSDEANLAARAAAALRDALGRSEAGAVLDIEKRIPVGAGLGGGSADAAAALRVLGRVWDATGETVRDVAIA
ncbi:MAG TPA: 4-(cytidine 5'-diphospho)-2-C-methyl-D-erythritol kinase, partial [Actinomycetota bacterium]|nr:4-(cytidine 5'-diphospho)-2-C-methyl-D-erythritol kinase [Actinomycetota bacterium]